MQINIAITLSVSIISLFNFCSNFINVKMTFMPSDKRRLCNKVLRKNNFLLLNYWIVWWRIYRSKYLQCKKTYTGKNYLYFTKCFYIKYTFILRLRISLSITDIHDESTLLYPQRLQKSLGIRLTSQEVSQHFHFFHSWGFFKYVFPVTYTCSCIHNTVFLKYRKHIFSKNSWPQVTIIVSSITI